MGHIAEPVRWGTWGLNALVRSMLQSLCGAGAEGGGHKLDGVLDGGRGPGALRRPNRRIQGMDPKGEYLGTK